LRRLGSFARSVFVSKKALGQISRLWGKHHYPFRYPVQMRVTLARLTFTFNVTRFVAARIGGACSSLVLSVYWPANPSSFFGYSDVVELTSDSEEAPIKTLEFTSGVLIREAAPLDFGILSGPYKKGPAPPITLSSARLRFRSRRRASHPRKRSPGTSQLSLRLPLNDIPDRALPFRKSGDVNPASNRLRFGGTL